MDSSFNLAVHALVCLSHSGRSLSSEALAENICTNPPVFAASWRG